MGFELTRRRPIASLLPAPSLTSITSGAHAGCRGVVTGLPDRELHRPTVRLLLDAGTPAARRVSGAIGFPHASERSDAEHVRRARRITWAR